MYRYLAPLLAVVLSMGCAHSVNELARETSRAAVDESVDKLTAEDSKKQIMAALTDPRVEESVTNLTDQVAEGVLRALESERARKQLQSITSVATRAAAQQLVATLGSPAVQEQMAQMTSNVTRAALVDLGGTLHDQFVPSLREALARDLADGAASGLQNGKFHDALGATAQSVAYQAVLGVNDGLRDSWLGDTGEDVRGVARAGIPWLKLTFWTLLFVAVSLFSLAALVMARARRSHAEVRRLESATLLLATAMRERHESTETDEIVSIVREALEKSAQDNQRHGLLGILRLRHH